MPYRYRSLVLAALTTWLVLGLGGTALAAETSSSDLVIIREGDTVEDDLYAAGLRVLIEGVVEGDLIAFAAEDVVITGEVTGSVIAIAPKVTVDGAVGGSIRVSGRELDVPGRIGKDLVAAVVSADLGPDSHVTGDVVVWAFDLTAAGTIGGDLEGTQRRLSLQGQIDGDVNVSVGRLAITGPLVVAGDLDYQSPAEASGLDQATVGGAVVHKTPVPPNIRIRALGLLTRFLVVLGLTAAALLVAWGWPDRTALAGERGAARPMRAYARGALIALAPLLLAGIAVLVAALAPASASLPLLAILVPLVVVTAGIILALSLVAGSPAVLALGRVLPGERGMFGAIALGSLMAGLLWMVPLVGWVVPLVILPWGLGAWILSFRAEGEQQKASDEAATNG
jgi:cytoskeletal protein CcmA (bactofilin family)